MIFQDPIIKLVPLILLILLVSLNLFLIELQYQQYHMFLFQKIIQEEVHEIEI